jgi:hypoxanthine phosphoribosyltransferase
MHLPLSRDSDTIVKKSGLKGRMLGSGFRQIVTRKELHEQSKHYGRRLDRWMRDRPVTLMPILHGAAWIWQQIVDEISDDSPHTERAIIAQSYGDGQAALPVEIHMQWIVPERDITDRDMVLIDDILDTGETMAAAIRAIEAHQPRSIQTLFMIAKRRERTSVVPATWVMFEIDDVWIVGAGLDDGGKYRHLRYIAERPRNE